MASTEVSVETVAALSPPNITPRAQIITAAQGLVVLHDAGQEQIVAEVASVLGQAWSTLSSVTDKCLSNPIILVGVGGDSPLLQSIESWKGDRIILSTHCIDDSSHNVGSRTQLCDHEYLYTLKPFFRRDLARFLALVLGQSNPHAELKAKKKTTLISTTFPDVHAALPNLDILSVGADAIELRVDLLEDKQPDGSYSPIPSIQYTGEQLMLLRQRTELPIIYTVRCTNENGRFPMDRPQLFYEYLQKAIQWGCEYIDVELWLPEQIRQTLYRHRRNTRILSAFHDFSGNFKWTAPEAQQLFVRQAKYADVVKMIAFGHTMQENYELEYFRTIIQEQYPDPPLSALNMGPIGQLSRALNKIFTPITHPLLPMIAAPGQMSASEINAALHTMGQLPRLSVYGIGNVRASGQATFFEKCFNELGLPHQLLCIDREATPAMQSLLQAEDFGGAHFNPSIPTHLIEGLKISDAANAIGQVDTVYVQTSGTKRELLADNATWKAVRGTLCRDFVPAAYAGQAALVLASQESHAAAVIHALRSLHVHEIHTIGFKATGKLANYIKPFQGIEDLHKAKAPSVIISALRTDRSVLVTPLLKHYCVKPQDPKHAVKVFVDITNGGAKPGDPVTLAESLGWSAYGMADVNAWTTVETLRLLVGQNVPYDFVRLASGSSLYKRKAEQ